MHYNFRSSLKAGQAGEAALHAMFPDWTRLDGRKADFAMPNGKLVELKTESRTTEQTLNVALELHSSEGRPGAIERAVADGVAYVVYMFANGVYFVYDALRLKNFLFENEGMYRHVFISNGSYASEVVLVPRAALKQIEVAFE